MNHFKDVSAKSIRQASAFLREECRTMQLDSGGEDMGPFHDVPAFKACIAAMKDEMKRRRKTQTRKSQ